MSRPRVRQLFLENAMLVTQAHANNTISILGSTEDTTPPQITGSSFMVDGGNGHVYVGVSVAANGGSIESEVSRVVMYVSPTDRIEDALVDEATKLLQADGTLVYIHTPSDPSAIFYFWIPLWDDVGNSSAVEYLGARVADSLLTGSSGVVTGNDIYLSFVLT